MSVRVPTRGGHRQLCADGGGVGQGVFLEEQRRGQRQTSELRDQLDEYTLGFSGK